MGKYNRYKKVNISLYSWRLPQRAGLCLYHAIISQFFSNKLS